MSLSPMSGPSATMVHATGGVGVEGSELINSGHDTTMYKYYYSLNIAVPNITSFFQFAAKNFVPWIRSADGNDPLPKAATSQPNPAEISDMVPPDPSLLPVSSIADMYTRLMLECKAGYPIFNPKPYSDLSMEYPRNGVNVGDVGFVRPDGTFDFLFNICPSHWQNISINPPNLPDGFTLETEENSTTTRPLVSHLCDNSLYTGAIKISSGEYICEGHNGAILELPEGVSEHEAVTDTPFLLLAKCRAIEWYEYTMTRRNIWNGSLYLVTSFTKCTQWGIAVFDRPCGPGEGLTFVRSPLGWKGLKGIIRKVAEPNESNTANQCVFLRGYRIKLREDIFDNLCNDQARRFESGITVRRQPAQQIRGGGGTNVWSRILTAGNSLRRSSSPTIREPDEIVLHADFNSPPFHPSDLINTALLNENPDAKIAIIHDDVWCELLRDNFPILNYGTLIDTARSYVTSFDEYGCVSLEKIPSIIPESDARSGQAGQQKETNIIGHNVHFVQNVYNLNNKNEIRGWSRHHNSTENPKDVVSNLLEMVPENDRPQLTAKESTDAAGAKHIPEDKLVNITNLVPVDPSSLPVSTIADRYARSMLECSMGYPLYEPQPFSELSTEYLRKGVNIGDVGFIRSDGAFDFLFNICPSQNVLINPPDLPSGFTLETHEEPMIRVMSPLPRKICLYSQTVTRKSNEYICKGPYGAILELPNGAVIHEAVNMRQFETHAECHGVEWYKYTMTRGRNIENGSLCLVTGITKCTDWGIAFFAQPCAPGQGVRFVQKRTILGKSTKTYHWKGSREILTKVANPKQDDVANQCVSLQGYKIKIHRKDVFDNLRNDQLRSVRRTDPKILSSSQGDSAEAASEYSI